jgi:hypothetical protein
MGKRMLIVLGDSMSNTAPKLAMALDYDLDSALESPGP